MCAIAGMVGIGSNQMINQKMLQTMHRRGPDGNGTYSTQECTLLHSRLAIIDPMGGAQPMSCQWEGKTYVIVYNGELYNTDEIKKLLRRLGHRFQSSCDTEVVLHSFAQWGEEALQILNGIFAFAVWIEQEKKLFLARDRMGVKPLFYKSHNSGVIFASEIKTILAHPDVDAELDAFGVAQVIMLGPGRLPGSGVFRNIRELEPGCCGWFTDGTLKTTKYWQLRDRIHEESFEDTAEHIRYLVTDAIKRQMVSDVPIGCFLSGGLDSSLISSVCAQEMKKNGGVLKTFSLDYRDNAKYFQPGKFQPEADTAYIDIMSEYLQTDRKWTVLTPEMLVDSLEEATVARDLPGMADVDFSLLLFCKDIRHDVKVALSGECADEIFGGYPWYRDPEIRDADGFPWAQNTAQRAVFLAPWIKQALDPLALVNDAYLETVNSSDILPENDPLETRMKQMVNLNYRWFMQTLLDRKDRMSMYHGLEVRVPFCDYRIAEYMYAVPWRYKDYNGNEKGLLRQAMEGYLPPEVLWRKKSPYPKTHDPFYMQLVSKMLTDLLKDRNAILFQIVDPAALESLLNEQNRWPWYGQLMQAPQTIAYMLQIDCWLRHFKVRIV